MQTGCLGPACVYFGLIPTDFPTIVSHINAWGEVAQDHLANPLGLRLQLLTSVPLVSGYDEHWCNIWFVKIDIEIISGNKCHNPFLTLCRFGLCIDFCLVPPVAAVFCLTHCT